MGGGGGWLHARNASERREAVMRVRWLVVVQWFVCVHRLVCVATPCPLDFARRAKPSRDASITAVCAASVRSSPSSAKMTSPSWSLWGGGSGGVVSIDGSHRLGYCRGGRRGGRGTHAGGLRGLGRQGKGRGDSLLLRVSIGRLFMDLGNEHTRRRAHLPRQEDKNKSTTREAAGIQEALVLRLPGWAQAWLAWLVEWL